MAEIDKWSKSVIHLECSGDTKSMSDVIIQLKKIIDLG